MNLQRLRVLKDGIFKSRQAVYWMQRNHRMYNNWALFFSQDETKVPR